MIADKDRQTLESVARGVPRFREYLADLLATQTKQLILLVDGEQMRRAQGQCQCLQNLIAQLDFAVSPPRR